MKPVRKRKMLLIVLIVSVLTLATLLVAFSLSQNISLFYTPAQVAAGEAPHDKPIRVGGMVVQGSIVRSNKDDLSVQFQITDYKHTLTVVYRGILPDLFREGQGIVAHGSLAADNQFQAREVLAKHDENYMPPEVKEALAQTSKEGSVP
ncbi:MULTISPECIES: cytochrome c maturation protein CcmE [Legionella]|uniref:Cytochrome c-type biogenesis protein CcmE n=1 Tax=Legionella septentrionalis TaxID=2498109 RepID=A0A433JH54_9GAMM|nr:MULTISPECIES: cytochrome c maturation protein CcmE [Legionella]MCP0914669.1 cytochrome c maturation protein CcmE [Legionella sp. 27cVA30]RUQ81614.1 cytochrome c maturation protein CcmE [Legionella septentrionalis]RUQ95740.1 cytochrome c maturation protein CcmE [Legionella septentrionalis]RUR09146.1 cytochrome c maturation protein CcmE [Legionella septentrionalis]RUR15653.1 cytochrome c maturation protein CcmE [Legionella septentrionalis]